MLEKIINVSVTTNAKNNEIIKLAKDNYKIKVSVPPVDGRANVKVVEIVAQYFGIKKYEVDIIRGHKNKNKLLFIKLPQN